MPRNNGIKKRKRGQSIDSCIGPNCKSPKVKKLLSRTPRPGRGRDKRDEMKKPVPEYGHNVRRLGQSTGGMNISNDEAAAMKKQYKKYGTEPLMDPKLAEENQTPKEKRKERRKAIVSRLLNR